MAGFVDFAITWRGDVFGGAPQSSSAASFGTMGITFRARRATSDEEWRTALLGLTCELPGASAPVFQSDSFYDAGDRGCAEGPLDEIARLMRSLPVGGTLEVRATDRSVQVDLPAWCRLTNNTLVGQQDDRYLIRRDGV